MKSITPNKEYCRKKISIEKTSEGLYFLYFSDERSGIYQACVILTEIEALEISKGLRIKILNVIPEYIPD